MSVPRPTGRSRPTLLLLIAAALTLLTLQFRGFEPLDSFQRGMRDLLDPVRSVSETAARPLRSAWLGVFDYDDLRDRTERLEKELARMRGRQLSSEADRELLVRLMGEVGIDYTTLDTVVVRILGTPPGNFSSYTIEVDKGLDDGLSEGMAVVTGAGLVGRLEVVDRSRSIVRLATHPAFRVGIRLVGSQDEGLARGGGASGYLVIDAGIRSDVEVALGEVVVTSGGRSRFPADIPVGRVLDPDPDADLDREILVEPAASLEHLSFLNVVLDPRQADAGPLERG
ncbi:MAG: rod shape-determining protein MreC [Actinomycetota bacterium]|jgi:rod shape-determining protein MreC|nr:rod shape-determining protein MreC [Actinomycetota bacterium]